MTDPVLPRLKRREQFSFDSSYEYYDISYGFVVEKVEEIRKNFPDIPSNEIKLEIETYEYDGSSLYVSFDRPETEEEYQLRVDQFKKNEVKKAEKKRRAAMSKAEKEAEKERQERELYERLKKRYEGDDQ